jgi:hypothetical protein
MENALLLEAMKEAYSKYKYFGRTGRQSEADAWKARLYELLDELERLGVEDDRPS